MIAKTTHWTYEKKNMNLTNEGKGWCFTRECIVTNSLWITKDQYCNIKAQMDWQTDQKYKKNQ